MAARGASTQKTAEEEMVQCQSKDRAGQPNSMEKWRYDLLHEAIMNVVPADDIGIMFKQLVPAVRANLSKENRRRITTLHHDVTTVKLDMEFRGELERIAGVRPQYLRQVSKS